MKNLARVGFVVFAFVLFVGLACGGGAKHTNESDASPADDNDNDGSPDDDNDDNDSTADDDDNDDNDATADDDSAVGPWTPMNSNTTVNLYGVWGSAGDDVYAVGYGPSDFHGTVMRYDGTSWTQFANVGEWPNAVWGTAHDDIYIVDGAPKGAVWHYDGSIWSEMNWVIDASLTSMWGSSSSDIFAVGTAFSDDDDDSAANGNYAAVVRGAARSGKPKETANSYGVILHYDGHDWTQMSTQYVPGFLGIWGSAQSDVFASGTFVYVLHYDGSSWSEMDTGGYGMAALWGDSNADVFGGDGAGVILRYNGSIWNATVAPANFAASAIWGTSPSDVFAAGDHYPPEPVTGEIAHFDGSSWITMSDNFPNVLAAVWGSGPSDVFAVGGNGMIVHYVGSR